MRYALNHCTQVRNNVADTITFTGPCMVTGKLYSVTVPIIGIRAYNEGEMIQTAFPSVSVDDREFLISGYSPEGWKKIFGEE
jgi:hypothetical protein